MGDHEPVDSMEIFDAIAQLAIQKGAAPLSKHEGCWEHEIDDQWWIAINGHKQEVACSKGPAVPPFHAYLEYNGWPAGIFSPMGGTICAGEAANERTLLDAVRARLAS